MRQAFAIERTELFSQMREYIMMIGRVRDEHKQRHLFRVQIEGVLSKYWSNLTPGERRFVVNFRPERAYDTVNSGFWIDGRPLSIQGNIDNLRRGADWPSVLPRDEFTKADVDVLLRDFHEYATKWREIHAIPQP